MLRAFPALQFWLHLKQRSQSDFRRLTSTQTKLSQVMSLCIFGHGHTFRTRDEEGYLALQCEDCGSVTRVLEQPTIKGPQLHAAPVKGAPAVTARVVPHKRSYPRSA